MKRILKHPLVLSFLIISALAYFNYQGWINPVSDVFFKSSSFIEKNIFNFSLKVNNFFNFLVSVNNLRQENNFLREEN